MAGGDVTKYSPLTSTRMPIVRSILPSRPKSAQALPVRPSIAINRASNRCRWWNRLRRRGTVSLDEHLGRNRNPDLSETLEAEGNSPEDALLLQEKRSEIERWLLRLPIHQRIAVVMRDVEGMSYEDIAEAMQVSLGTFKSRIARGREELKRRLNGELG